MLWVASMSLLDFMNMQSYLGNNIDEILMPMDKQCVFNQIQNDWFLSYVIIFAVSLNTTMKVEM